MTEIPRYITIEDAMRMLGIKSRTTFNKVCKQLDIHKHRVGRSIRIKLSQIQDRVDSSRVA